MSFKSVTVKGARVQQGKGYTYVDVRSVPEFVEGHPAGAVNVPLLHRDERTGQMSPNREFLDVIRANFPPDAKLLMGCQVGGRSAQAAQILSDAGYSDVANVLGGFDGARDPASGAIRAEGWIQASLPVESGAGGGQSYDELHAKATVGGR
jgi:rhodanese-related sulfurtransferase